MDPEWARFIFRVIVVVLSASLAAGGSLWAIQLRDLKGWLRELRGQIQQLQADGRALSDRVSRIEGQLGGGR